MLCSLSLGMLDALIWSFEIAFMAYASEAGGDFQLRGGGGKLVACEYRKYNKGCDLTNKTLVKFMKELSPEKISH